MGAPVGPWLARNRKLPETQTDSKIDFAALAEQATGLLRNSDPAAAEQLIATQLQGCAPQRSHKDALYVLSVARRYQGKLQQALESLGQLIGLEPGYGRAYQELGYTRLRLGQRPEARQAFEKALQLNPALSASWKNLAELYAREGLEVQRRAAQREFQALQALPRELLSVTSMFHEGRLYRAEQLCRHYLRQHPHHIEAMRLLALIGSELGILTDAEFLLESCLEFAPQNQKARFDYANLLLKMQRFGDAYKQSELLVQSAPDDPRYLSLLANAASGIGQHREAIEIYERVLRQSPKQTQLLVMRGHAQKTIGELQAAIASYHQAFRVKPDHGDAFWSLANTKTYRFSDAEVRHMMTYESNEQTSKEDRIHLCFALGKAFEDQGVYDRSFEFYQRGNELKQAQVSHRATHLNIRTSAQIEICDKGLFERKANVGHPAPDPIFIVGMPRAGSTLLEQILASHSMVDGTHELPNIIALVHRLRGAGAVAEATADTPVYPRILEGLEDDYFRRFGEQYIEQTRVYRQGAAYFIDKNPNNFFHVGLIRLMLPKARVIDARRHPMSCCFSGFKQLWGQGQEFSYSLESIGNYYREYVELMEHWERVLPGFTLLVQYEDVVSDLENQVRRVLDFCGLPFETGCLEFHKTERSVRTPSSEQVRQPIYRSGLEQWRHYEPWLGPLKEALGPELRKRYDIEL